MTPLIRFALGLVVGGLAVKTLRNTVFQDKTTRHPSDTSPDSSPAAAKKRSQAAASRTKTSP